MSFPFFLEHQAILVIREAFIQFKNPVILFSGGKDSLTLVHLCIKAFHPAKMPIPILHIDTGHNFPETLRFRDDLIKRYDLKLIIRSVEDTIRSGRALEAVGEIPSRNWQQAQTLKDALDEFNFDAALGGARRDEEKARSKEKFFSLRDKTHSWNPLKQRIELWDLYNGLLGSDERMRVFPLSNWTEIDIWSYLKLRDIKVPTLYFAHERDCYELTNKKLIAASDFLNLPPSYKMVRKQVRFRTVGDMTCTSAIESNAKNIDEVIKELNETTMSERNSRIDDEATSFAMEKRKKEGYF